MRAGIAAGCFAASFLFAQVAATQPPDTPPRDQASREQVEAYLAKQKARLHPKSGVITLEGGNATLHLPNDFGYLNPDETAVLLHDIWGNPPGTPTLGAIIPTSADITSRQGWGVIITAMKDGYVKDDDAENINYDTLLKQIQDSEKEANAKRGDDGYAALELVGWAEKPHYDKATHKLYWAKELRASDSSERYLNYDIRTLGRSEVLVFSIVSLMDQLPMIDANKDKLLSFVEFMPTHRYADFNPNTDKVAAYGMAALVAGFAAAKVGLLKPVILALLALKKFIILGGVAVAAYFKKLFGRKDKNK